MFGMIFQDFRKYAFSVGKHFGDIFNPPRRVEAAAKARARSEYISRPPLGYDTRLCGYPRDRHRAFDRPVRWQPARAFYGSSDVVILDEPTSALDPMAEQEIYDRFDELRKNKTTIFVSTACLAPQGHKIIVLETAKS